MSYFSDLGLAEPLLRALEHKGYSDPTPIQRQAIPPLIEGRDLLGLAQTGTGKTAAFALPSLHRMMANPLPRKSAATRMLVLSPTRELAAQIADAMRMYAKYLPLNIQCVFGGVPVGKQARALVPGCDVLVATPGRLLDLIDQRALTLRHVEIFVLDEADQMMDLGFIHALRRVSALLPKERQSLFFSATMPTAIAQLGQQFIRNPVKVEVTPQATTAERVEQRAIFVNQPEKQALLTLKLREGLATDAKDPIDRALVFTRTKHGADRVVRHLSAAGVAAAAIHGNKSQPQRTAALNGFRQGSVRVLVATDIAARGIDIPGVSHVFNFEIPNVAEQYVHRIGRTARAGASGIALSFIAPDEKPYMRDIERLTRMKLVADSLPENFTSEAARLPAPTARTEPADERRSPRQGRDGQRPRSDGQRPRSDDRRPHSDGQRPRSDDRRPRSDGQVTRSDDRRDFAQRGRSETRGDTGASPRSDDRRDTGQRGRSDARGYAGAHPRSGAQTQHKASGAGSGNGDSGNRAPSRAPNRAAGDRQRAPRRP